NVQEPDGYWQIDSAINFSRVDLFGTPDGLRRVFAVAEDLAGNENAVPTVFDYFLDVSGPTVSRVSITNVGGHNLFGIKNVDGTTAPTPRIDSLTIDLLDGPNRVAPNFLFNAVQQQIAENPGHYQLIGDHTGIIAIDTITVTNNPVVGGQPASASVVLTFFEPLPDDRFTLTVFDEIIDPANNGLDGESNADQPNGGPPELVLPSGDGVPGGDFVARFTVDSRPEVGTHSQGIVYADINGNGVWDPEGEDNDQFNRDLVFNFGQVTDGYFAGQFTNVGGTNSGFDRLGTYGRFDSGANAGTFGFQLDTDDDGVPDLVSLMPAAFQVNAIPVAGNFSAAKLGDEIGAFDGQNFYLDTNGNNQIDANEQFPTDLRGIPVVGDFNGDGNDDFATYNNATGVFTFDTDGDFLADDSALFGLPGLGNAGGFSGFGEKPVAGDLNLDGIDDLGLWVPGREGVGLDPLAEYHFLVSDRVAALPSAVFDAYSPRPLGNDLFYQFGDEFGLPVFGNFDPPTNTSDDGDTSNGGDDPIDFHDLDVNQDGLISAVDAVEVIGHLARASRDSLSMLDNANRDRRDVDGDGDVAALDALRIIQHLASQSRDNVSGESINFAPDAVFASGDDLAGDNDDDLIGDLAINQLI
ncbi:MAG: dockerin type I domain-containing protein, partial [Planctomycetota bacterium]